MLNIGDLIEIRGKEALVCFLAEYEGDKYLCASFEEEKIRIEIYKYKFEDNKFFVSKVEDEEELKATMGIFFEQSVEEFGIPEEISKALDEYFNLV